MSDIDSDIEVEIDTTTKGQVGEKVKKFSKRRELYYIIYLVLQGYQLFYHMYFFGSISFAPELYLVLANQYFWTKVSFEIILTMVMMIYLGRIAEKIAAIKMVNMAMNWIFISLQLVGFGYNIFYYINGIWKYTEIEPGYPFDTTHKRNLQISYFIWNGIESVAIVLEVIVLIFLFRVLVDLGIVKKAERYQEMNDAMSNDKITQEKLSKETKSLLAKLDQGQDAMINL